ncbi:hypothetical protein [Dryocola sp. BD626]|jgi:hypothetical protein|uniref:hypothetical protein n=1 Tax=Dryocola sp. BD626 TaxID=3133273 RepID=UPI003F50C327
MKKITLALLSGTFLFAAAGAMAQNPANSTSTMQAEKEQLNNPGHIIDDCRATEGQAKTDCKSAHEMKKEHKNDDKMLKQGDTKDDVEQQDTQKTN